MDSLIMELRPVKKGEQFTHTSMIKSKSYSVDEEDENNFWIRYCNAVTKKQLLDLTEKPGRYGPLRTDFDLRYNVEDGLKRYYKEEHIKEIVKIYQDIIKDIVKIDAYNDKMLWCLVLERSKPRIDEGVVKDGFHLHFPFFNCENEIQDQYIRKEVLKKIGPVHKKLKTINDIQKMVDPVARKTWLMYGSTKSEKTDKTKIVEPFKISRQYDQNLKHLTIDEFFKDEYDSLKGKKSRLTYYLPRFLSIRNINEGVPLIDSVCVKKKRIYKNETVDSLEALKEIEDGNILEMLSDERADRYEDWMEIGWTLYCIGQGCEKALDMWIDFSKRSNGYKEGECEKLWSKMTIKETSHGIKTIATLLGMAKLDNLEKYQEWRMNNLKLLLYKSISTKKPTHYAIASVFKKLYENRFICADVKKNIWYEFKDHRWHPMDDGSTIIKMLCTEVTDLYMDFERKELKEKRDTYDMDSDNYKEYQEKMKRASHIKEELGQTPFCEKVLKMCKILFHDAKFLSKIDENKSLLGFENGVYDLKLSCFRDGRPDDYITMSCGLNYCQYDYDDQEIVNINEFLEKIFVNPKLRNYFLDFICSCLQGGNVNKKFVIFTGGTHGGKTITVKLLERTFGGYRHNFPRETFVMTRGETSGPKPELASVRGKRIALAKELAKNEKLHIGRVKEYTGNDSFWARSIYEKGGDINPMFTLILMCNEPPEVPAHDDATWGRIRVLPFESYFPENDDEVPEDPEEQKQKKIFYRDPEFEEKLTEMAEPFMWLLLERFKKYKQTRLREPKEVKLETKKYKEDNDVYLKFLEDRVEVLEGKDADKKFIKLQEMYTEFTEWYKEEYASYTKEKITKSVLKKEISKRLKPIGDRSRWYGVGLKVEDEEEEESEQNSEEEPIFE